MPAGLHGLSEVAAAKRLAHDGPNVIPEVRPHPAWRLLLAELTHFFALMLWFAAALALVAGLPELALAIIVVIVINGLFAFAQERRAERAAQRLRDLMPRSATVIRNGRLSVIDARELVVGDVVVLEPGDQVSADGVVREQEESRLDCSMLTGESQLVAVAVGTSVYAGTFAVEGRALVNVTATGAHTRLASIALLTHRARRPQSPLTRELDRVVRVIAVIAVATGAACFGLALVLGTPATDGFLFAIGVTVALVPEGLLPTVTVSLAVGAQRMAGVHALVRHLEAVETLGSTTVICTDKTGTLTRNEMTVVRWWTSDGVVDLSGPGYGPDAVVTGSDAARRAASAAATIAATASTGALEVRDGSWRPVGDPMEGALIASAHRLAGTPAIPSSPIRARFPFDPIRRRMSVLTEDGLAVKGAPDAVRAVCVNVPEGLDDVIAQWAGAGLRLIAVARRTGTVPDEMTAAERDLDFVGLAALEDPPRTEVRDAIASVRGAGIRVLMVTGDHPATATAIAREVGLALPKSPVLIGAELPEDIATLGSMIRADGTVIARVDPETKLRIAQALQADGGVVAMTGDGVNDGPALQAADTGIAMGAGGTDIARAAADVVLLDDNFATIVNAVEQGRATYFNVRRFLTYHLSDNVAELLPFVFWALSGGRIPLALTVLQVLAIDIGTDIFPALALGAEPASERALTRPPPRLHLLDRSLLARVFGLLGPMLALTEMVSFFIVLTVFGWDFRSGQDRLPPVLMASGTAFAAVVIGQMANALACRSTSQAPWRLHRRNPFIWRALVVEFAILLALVCIQPVAAASGMQAPPWWGWVLASVAFPVMLTADGSAKALRRLMMRHRVARREAVGA